MKNKFTIGFACGALLFGAAGVFAGQYIATENPFPIQLNGQNIDLEGYNIDGSTYFKLRDIAGVVGGFEVDFNNDTIQLSKDGYVYNNNISSETNENEPLKKYAKENISSITDPISGTVFTNIKYLLADVTGDYINDLLAVGIDSDNEIAYIDIYQYNNGNIAKILSDHCQAYQGGCVLPLRHNGDIHIGTFNYSSSSGFLKQLLKYQNNEWRSAYSSYISYDLESGQIIGYIVNGQSVSEQEYDGFNSTLESGILTTSDFVSSEEL